MKTRIYAAMVMVMLTASLALNGICGSEIAALINADYHLGH